MTIPYRSCTNWMSWMLVSATYIYLVPLCDDLLFTGLDQHSWRIWYMVYVSPLPWVRGSCSNPYAHSIWWYALKTATDNIVSWKKGQVPLSLFIRMAVHKPMLNFLRGLRSVVLTSWPPNMMKEGAYACLRQSCKPSKYCSLHRLGDMESLFVCVSKRCLVLLNIVT